MVVVEEEEVVAVVVVKEEEEEEKELHCNIGQQRPHPNCRMNMCRLI